MTVNAADKLGILSVFLTVDGECNVFGPGNWSVFVRTRGCTVGCHYCDTKYSWANKGGALLTPEELVAAVKKVGGKCMKVTLTGGEPLEQDWVTLAKFVMLLIDDGYSISVETAGTQDVEEFRAQKVIVADRLRHHPGLSFIIDYKLPSAHATSRNVGLHVYAHLRQRDRIKFVVGSTEDFEEAFSAAMMIRKYNRRTPIYFSPVHGFVSPADLMKWMVESRCFDYDIRLNLQMHKYVWPADSRTEENAGIDFTKRSLGRDAFLQRAHTPDTELETSPKQT